MLHELLFSLLGFTGDIIIEEGGAYKVKDGFDLLREGERDQINRIAPLGWYYTNLGSIVQRYDVSWSPTARPEAYMTGLVQGVSDLLQEYVADVSYLEQLILSEGPIPLSQILQHLQKYVLVFPQLFAMLQELESSNIRGCRLLDHFHNFNTGIPVLKEVISRIVQRLRVVFLKQLFAWMIHGELEDPGNEFFILSKSVGSQDGRADPMAESSSNGLHDRVLKRLFAAKGSTADQFRSSTSHTDSSSTFDWSASYSLSLNKIASSHISPRIASKILFAGKAVKLLQSSGSAGTPSTRGAGRPTGGSTGGFTFADSEAYRYLSSGADVTAAVVASADDDDGGEDLEGNSGTEVAPLPDGKTTQHASPVPALASRRNNQTSNQSSSQTRVAFQTYVESGGFTVEDTVLFTQRFSDVLAHPDQAVELLESAVEAINDTISNRLWVLLRDSFGFLSFLQVIRSTYLLGRGELFQSLLDGILTLTYTATPEPLEMDNILNWKVLRTSAKVIGLENDDSLNDLIQLRVNHSELSVKNFSLHTQDLQLGGAAVEATHPHASLAHLTASRAGAVRVGQRTMVELCRPTVSSSHEQFERIWSQYLRKKVVGRDEQSVSMQIALDQEEFSDPDEDSLDGTAFPEPSVSHSRSGRQSSDTPAKALKYSCGSVGLVDQKHVTRGFNWCTTFMCGWNEIRAHLTPKHPSFRHIVHDGTSDRVPFPPPGSGARVVTLGSISCSLRGDRKASWSGGVHGSGGLVGGVGTLTVGASFHAMTVAGASGVRYFARAFVRCGSARGTSSGASQLHLHHHSQLSVASFRHSLDLSAAGNQHEGDVLLSEEIIDIDDNLRDLGFGNTVSRSISSAMPFKLEVEYVRSLQQDRHRAAAQEAHFASDLATLNSLGTDRFSFATYAGTGAGAGVVYQLRVRLTDSTTSTSLPSSASPHSDHWDLQHELDISPHVKCQGGQAFVSLDAAGIILSSHSDQAHSRNDRKHGASPSFFYQVHSLDFAGKGVLSTYPVASSSTFTRYPDTFARIQSEVDKVRAWMHLKLQLAFPPMFRVIFDAEAVGCYERIFAAIMKVRVVAHALERLWIARSRLASDRGFCQSRHSMHFFVSNLLYYLQVDVVDSEYSTLQKEIATATDFQSVLRAHKTFTSNMLRLSLIDHTSVQEGIERILQICLRFIAVSRILHQAEFVNEDIVSGDQEAPIGPPIYVPPEEFGHIRKDFFAQVSMLFQLMRKVESRGFIFRLDFNGYLSNASLEHSESSSPSRVFHG